MISKLFRVLFSFCFFLLPLLVYSGHEGHKELQKADFQDTQRNATGCGARAAISGASLVQELTAQMYAGASCHLDDATYAQASTDAALQEALKEGHAAGVYTHEELVKMQLKQIIKEVDAAVSPKLIAAAIAMALHQHQVPVADFKKKLETFRSWRERQKKQYIKQILFNFLYLYPTALGPEDYKVIHAISKKIGIPVADLTRAIEFINSPKIIKEGSILQKLEAYVFHSLTEQLTQLLPLITASEGVFRPSFFGIRTAALPVFPEFVKDHMVDVLEAPFKNEVEGHDKLGSEQGSSSKESHFIFRLIQRPELTSRPLLALLTLQQVLHQLTLAQMQLLEEKRGNQHDPKDLFSRVLENEIGKYEPIQKVIAEISDLKKQVAEKSKIQHSKKTIAEQEKKIAEAEAALDKSDLNKHPTKSLEKITERITQLSRYLLARDRAPSFKPFYDAMASRLDHLLETTRDVMNESIVEIIDEFTEKAVFVATGSELLPLIDIIYRALIDYGIKSELKLQFAIALQKLIQDYFFSEQRVRNNILDRIAGLQTHSSQKDQKKYAQFNLKTKLEAIPFLRTDVEEEITKLSSEKISLKEALEMGSDARRSQLTATLTQLKSDLEIMQRSEKEALKAAQDEAKRALAHELDELMECISRAGLKIARDQMIEELELKEFGI